MHKLISSAKDSDDLSIGFHRSIQAREQELSNNKTTKGNYHVRIYLKNIFGYAEDQYNCTFGLGYKLTLQRNSDNHVLSHPAGADDAANRALAGRVIINDISWYVPHYTPSVKNQKLMLEHISRIKLQQNYHILNDHLIWKMLLLKITGPSSSV